MTDHVRLAGEDLLLKWYNGITCHMHAHTIKDINVQQHTIDKDSKMDDNAQKVVKEHQLGRNME